MDYDPNYPIYLQIMDKIKLSILTGKLKQGEKMPSLQDMALQMDVNPNTMYRVYTELESAGCIESQRGRGSFVSNDEHRVDKLRQEKIAELAKNFITGLRNLEFSDKEIMDIISSKLKEY
ncbi:GntR family transcriptional regulator [Treponema phagedenis]|uniref:GntR family transcriptional regulator n=1 Tax=Treponema phagedenis TaxID=162 RepID=UPI0011F02576|nr:GntR family transcriptional regulator [Treponema phagedenis]TYT76470.1 GntR family transcriptional regulator [Treponema phagedenis]TYT76891.1 GntR family transcriptional regulator [Treponema phagedenis]TYT79817.1 GntR family transcriptional regulator [Treponema phagedenis]